MIRVNGKKVSWREGMTVADLLKILSDSDHCAVVRINDKHVSRPFFEKTLIPDNSDVFLIPMIVGG
jgi:thiamine biosynthesis protein ThiS